MFGPSSDTSLWIETDAYGRVQDVAPEAARLLGLSARGLHSRDLRLFFPRSYSSVSELLRKAANQPVERAVDLYPRDRKPLRVLIQIGPAAPEASPTVLRWTIERT
jgi:nitrogen-specific signal transduction histidine kinase